MAFTSRVGLGSPHLDFRPQWAPARRRESGDFDAAVVEVPEPAPVETLSGSTSGKVSRSSSPGKTGSYFDREVGLPSPPRSNSDIALPEAPDASLMNEVSVTGVMARVGTDETSRLLHLLSSRRGDQ